MRKVTVMLLPTFTVPVLTTVEDPFGPVTVQLTVLICSPPGRVSCMLTEPVPSATGNSAPTPSGVTLPSGVVLVPGDEQPTCAPTIAAAPAAPSSNALRMSFAFDLMDG